MGMLRGLNFFNHNRQYCDAGCVFDSLQYFHASKFTEKQHKHRSPKDSYLIRKGTYFHSADDYPELLSAIIFI